jgi:23S rRNA pseudouridine955/2504/2580 synthase
MPKPSGTIDLPLSVHQQTAESKARRGVNFQDAVTHYRVVRNGADCALLECRIETGRTHQIRRHLASVGHPVAGDRRYGDFDFNREAKARWGLRRLFLHAERIEAPHPRDGASLRVEAPVPEELRTVLKRAALSTS